MAVHFTYSDTRASADLQQGDILRRSEQLEVLLKSFYPRYAANLENKYFIVLTQGCDLVRRSAPFCDSPYISIAPVRPLSVALQRRLQELMEAEVAPGLPVCTHQGKSRLQNWLERVLNNNEANYFYLRKEPTKGISEDCCAFLALSFALKSDPHYQTCLDSRLLSLAPMFQAKLGWLVGQMYSRVGTDDWPPVDMSTEIAAVLRDLSIWVDQKKLKPLKELVRVWTAANPGQAMDRETLVQLVERVPRKKEELVSRVVEVLKAKALLPDQHVPMVQNLIRNDPAIAALLPD